MSYTANEIANLCHARTEAIEHSEKLRKALENCYAMACRRERKCSGTEQEFWNHIVRICEEAGMKPQILR